MDGQTKSEIYQTNYTTLSTVFASSLNFFFFLKESIPSQTSFPQKMGTILVLSNIVTFFLTAMLIGSSIIQCSVTYDKKAIVVNGHRRILLSGSIHYPRSTPEVSNLSINSRIFLFCFFSLIFVDFVDVGRSYKEG